MVIFFYTRVYNIGDNEGKLYIQILEPVSPVGEPLLEMLVSYGFLAVATST